MNIHIGFADAVRGAMSRGDAYGWRHEGWRINREAFKAPLHSTPRRIRDVFLIGSETITAADREAWRVAQTMRDAIEEAEAVIRSNRMRIRAGGRL